MLNKHYLITICCTFSKYFFLFQKFVLFIWIFLSQQVLFMMLCNVDMFESNLNVKMPKTRQVYIFCPWEHSKEGGSKFNWKKIHVPTYIVSKNLSLCLSVFISFVFWKSSIRFLEIFNAFETDALISPNWFDLGTIIKFAADQGIP